MQTHGYPARDGLLQEHDARARLREQVPIQIILLEAAGYRLIVCVVHFDLRVQKTAVLD